MRHDMCYVACESSCTQTGEVECKEECDGNLVRELRALGNDVSRWPHPPRAGTETDTSLYRWGAIQRFAE